MPQNISVLKISKAMHFRKIKKKKVYFRTRNNNGQYEIYMRSNILYKGEIYIYIYTYIGTKKNSNSS